MYAFASYRGHEYWICHWSVHILGNLYTGSKVTAFLLRLKRFGIFFQRRNFKRQISILENTCG